MEPHPLRTERARDGPPVEDLVGEGPVYNPFAFTLVRPAIGNSWAPAGICPAERNQEVVGENCIEGLVALLPGIPKIDSSVETHPLRTVRARDGPPSAGPISSALSSALWTV